MKVEQELLISTSEGIAFITLNRPEVHNALNTEMITQMTRALHELQERSDCQVVVLQGNGQSFCSGLDIKEVVRKALPRNRDFYQRQGELLLSLESLRKPLICSAKGYVLGNGCALAAASDLVIAAKDAIFGLPEMDFQVFPMLPLVPLLHCVGKKKAFELLFTAKRIPAQEAERIGLVNMVVAADELDKETLRLAKTLASKNPIAVKLGKEVLASIRNMPYAMSMRYACDMLLVQHMEKGGEGSLV